MKNSVSILLVALFSLLSSSLLLSADKVPPKQDVKHWMYYWEKGNRGKQISRGEFKILMSNLEEKLSIFKAASSKISIEDSYFSGETGKGWEIELQSMREEIEAAFKFIKAVKKNPDSMTSSLLLYVNLTKMTQTAYDFNRIERFEKVLNATHSDLNLWCSAFLKAHLFPLAAAKDKGKAYRMK